MTPCFFPCTSTTRHGSLGISVLVWSIFRILFVTKSPSLNFAAFFTLYQFAIFVAAFMNLSLACCRTFIVHLKLQLASQQALVGFFYHFGVIFRCSQCTLLVTVSCILLVTVSFILKLLKLCTIGFQIAYMKIKNSSYQCSNCYHHQYVATCMWQHTYYEFSEDQIVR